MKQLISFKQSQRFHFYLIAIGWIIFQLYFFFRFGIGTNLEATKYIDQANLLLDSGNYSSGNYLFYSTEILLIALSKKLHTGYELVVAVQLLFNAVSVYCFYYLVIHLKNNKGLAFIFTAIFLSMIYYHLYNVYLFTESLYFSFSIIYTYLLFRIKKLSFKNIAIIIFVLAALYFTRPVGLFFIPATIVFIILKFFSKNVLRLFLFTGIIGIILLYFLINYSLNSGGELDFLLPYLDERIICGVPTISTAHQINVPVEKDSIEGLWFIISHNWNLFIRLSLKRLFAFFGVVRTYYSLAHNLFIAFYFYTLYIMILLGIPKLFKRFLPEAIFMISIIFFTAITVMLSCDEWHNRFILAVLPFFLLISVSFFIDKKKPHNNYDQQKTLR